MQPLFQDDEQADELQDDLFGARLDPFTLLEGMGAQETGDDAASGLQPYEILARTARMAREREAGRSKAANEASGSEEVSRDKCWIEDQCTISSSHSERHTG